MFAIQGFDAQRQQIPVQSRPSLVGGLGLGNASIQFAPIHRPASIAHFLRPTPKLQLLKLQRFVPEGREDRIAKSLAALNQQETLNLSAEQWKYFAEDPDLDDQD
jgi:hypothetical protein